MRGAHDGREVKARFSLHRLPVRAITEMLAALAGQDPPPGHRPCPRVDVLFAILHDRAPYLDTRPFRGTAPTPPPLDKC